MYRYILLSLLLIFTTCATAHSLDRIVAVVNDGIITERQVQDETHKMRAQLKQTKVTLPSEATLHERALDYLIDKELQLQLAKNAGVEVTDAALEQTINDIANRNHITVAILKQKLAEEGINFSNYRQDLRDQMITSQLQQRQLASTITVTEDELKQIQNKIKSMPQGMARYHMIDIFIPLSENAQASEVTTAQAKAQDLLAQLHKGADFSRLAISEAMQTRLPNGGDFGWQMLDQLPDLFAEKIQHMSKGQVIGPLRAGNGLHIIKLEDVQGGVFSHYSKQTHLRHILIKTDKVTNDEIAKVRLLQLKEKLQRGADFVEMAKANSQDPLSNTKGGDLGWVPEGALDSNFEKTMNHLKVGQVGGPVKTPFGWHLMQVLGRRQAEDSKDLLEKQARNIAYQQKIQQSLPGWLAQLRSSAYVKKY